MMTAVKQFYYVIRVEDPDRGPWKVSTVEYNYNLRDADNQVVLAFHRHPAERFTVRHPHLHLDQGARLGRNDLHRTHIPTGRLSVDDIIRYFITKLGIEPLRNEIGGEGITCRSLTGLGNNPLCVCSTRANSCVRPNYEACPM